MKQIIQPSSLMVSQVERNRNFLDLIQPKGKFGLQHFRKGELIGVLPFPNGVTDAGKMEMLNRMFNGNPQTSLWYLGLIDGSTTTPVLATSDTSASHPGWTEFVTYNETTRQAWTKGAASNNIVTGTTSAVFTVGNVGANAFVAGGFVIDNNTKSGNSGMLWSTGIYQNPVAVQPTDVFRLAYITGL